MYCVVSFHTILSLFLKDGSLTKIEIITTNFDFTFQTSSDITTVEETSLEGSGKVDMAEIHNLTAEIESFVRHADTDEDKLRESPEKSTKPVVRPPSPARRSSIDQITQTKPYVARNSPPTQGRTRNSPPKQIVTTKVTMTSRSSPESSGPSSEDRIVETIVSAPNETIIRPPTSTRVSPENNDEYPIDRSSETPERDVRVASRETSPVVLVKVNSEKQLNVSQTSVTTASKFAKSSPPKIIIRGATEDYEDSLEEQPLPPAPNHAVTTPRSSEVEFILEHEQHEIVRTYHTPKPQTIDELKITESCEDLTSDAKQSTPAVDLEKYQIRYVPLRNFTPEPEYREVEQHKTISKELNSNGIIYNSRQNSQSTSVVKSTEIDKKPTSIMIQSKETMRQNDVQATLPGETNEVVIVRKVPPEPPQRRRSVKDIIASINKCQSLLKINQENGATHKPSPQYSSIDQIPPNLYTTNASYASPSNQSGVQNINELQNDEKPINKIVSEMEYNNNITKINNTNSNHIDVRHIPIMAERFDEFNNDELFKKCVVRRDKSEMDWNPLPKPRRSRNLTHEAEMGNL